MHKRNDPVLVIVASHRDQIHFAFPSSQMALLIGLFALAAGLALFFQGGELQEKSMLSYWFLWFLEIAFLWGTIFSLTMKSSLHIDRSQEKVCYVLSSLFRKKQWEKPFCDFQEVRIFRPRTGDGRAAMLKILLVMQDGEEIPLGTSLFGICQKRNARSLAQKVAEMISLKVIEEYSLDKKT
ncbi:hypothetical protein PCC7418_3439 [Halothece sp. PCC 7418]|uniref:hypothetical protein n=1 Tax=Halothece sp. (strain PCC 7418) TaxID=65093 RepID=UPI0002A062E4|nr:hypothetical protein [Halothece sp. PCC 7418]AFZ45553.1 hypothetical protein PCC7418_3439 [Halothece sp. PCC 7418]